MKNMKTLNPGLEPYKPLLVIIGVVFVGALALNHHAGFTFMHAFMGLFFLIFALFKLFDLKGFVKGFAMYDLITKKVPQYGYVYPFIELALGLSYLAGTMSGLTDLITMLVMFLSAAGVMKAIGDGMDVNCACLGTTLKVPLSTVSIVENAGMGLMALLSLVFN